MAGTCNQLDNLPNDPVQRTDVLRVVAYTIQDLWDTDPRAADLEYVAQKVGNVARTESNRISLGESGLLDLICSIVSNPSVSSGLMAECLRIIGNSSADQDENRERVVASGCLPRIISFLSDDSILKFAIPVLFNVCVDYKPAQKAIYQAGIGHQLVRLISGPMSPIVGSVLTYISKLLDFVANQEYDADLVDLDTPYILLGIANNQDLSNEAEDYMGNASVALTYLAHDQFQQTYLRAPGSITLFLQSFSKACVGFDIVENDEQTQLKQIQTTFTATLADLSAQPLFASSCSLDGQEVQVLRRWISTPHIALQSGACLALGNIARSYETCTYFVQKSAIHTPLLTILSDSKNVDASLLHCILSFLKNLAIPPVNKSILVDAGLLDLNVLPYIWGLDTQPQVQFDAASLARLLVVDCPENVRLMCAPLSKDPASPEHARSRLHMLMDLNKRSDQEPTVMETARAIMTVCRVLHSTIIPSDPKPIDLPISAPGHLATGLTPTSKPAMETHQLPSLKTFYAKHSTITDAMLRLAQQSKYPNLRTEVLLVLALMARTTEGAATIARALHQPETATLITELATREEATTQEVNGEKTTVQEVDDEETTAHDVTNENTTAASENSRTVGNTDHEKTTADNADHEETNTQYVIRQKPTAESVDNENTTAEKSDHEKTTAQEIDNEETTAQEPNDERTTAEHGHDRKQDAQQIDNEETAQKANDEEPTATDTGNDKTIVNSDKRTATDADRENTLVLIAELLHRCPEELPAALRPTFEDLLRQGRGPKGQDP
ncbi:armadillo-type protein [Xylaria intraflava]|nr:armadillo-type protein [Xylaria intraflava]